ncbi:bifunctional phosphopantothenoylcysteine decarboxylase/phosphopantothenate synthase [Porphyrobacter sp. YT40]|uniref:bifunctional phosphopantothenoylcysteine decarboxylase/phosphopantothenate synthase n=1 Tax=Porphyrobacter sp. YT40 TaxID=2547601 RepID=UPI001143036E|nr:bifunctional phosphopantothenoylcysteine decarboxylase/phosphopantothenate synthase [Porphyrobacter sp. YT40]QDH35977.1 bifunctional phosphopantothenoylcysteine decarboxylase/phosphopantothenate synthase [Porphyrobacter sp. YT40]
MSKQEAKPGKAPRILLVVGGGIAAYKACELVRLARKGGAEVTCVLTKGGQQFVTPLSLAALSENQVYTNLFDLKNEAEMGHIQLSREADLVVVCPATADLVAKMANGIADDLATTLILATDKPVMAVPAMNVRMWEHVATRRNIATLKAAGVTVLHPDEGPMACGEFGYGRLPEPEAIWREVASALGLAVPEPALAPPAAPAPARLPAPEIEVEALEPEEEDDGSAAMPEGGLGGFLSRLIPRSTAKRTHEEIEAEFEELPEPEDLPLPEEEPAPDFAPDLGGPLLARKGAASAAPPIDAGAINHMVDPRKAPPEFLAPEVPEEIEADLGEVPDGDALGVDAGHRPLAGRHVLVTAGPTWEAIDPVRYIANRSSGKQGFAIAAAAAALGAEVTLVAGPVALKTPLGVNRIDVESANDMAQAVRQALPADVAVMVAAVADWRPREYRNRKVKKRESAPPALMLTENPDILTNLSVGVNRPGLLIGFAAETDKVIENAKAKRKRKGADWIIANDVSGPLGSGVMGGDRNRVTIISADGIETLEEMPKAAVAMALVERIAAALHAEAAE